MTTFISFLFWSLLDPGRSDKEYCLSGCILRLALMLCKLISIEFMNKVYLCSHNIESHSNAADVF